MVRVHLSLKNHFISYYSFTFPTVLIIYQTIFAIITAGAACLVLFAPAGLLCNSRNLLQNIRNRNPSTFCQLTGMYHVEYEWYLATIGYIPTYL